MSAANLTKVSTWMWLSVAAAVATIGLKSWAALLSGSVGFLSDAMESAINLVAAVVTMFALRWSEAPPDEEHPFGHAKGELLAALLEGTLVLVAGLAIVATSIERFLHPMRIERVPVAMALSAAAAAINALVGSTLVSIGRKRRSVALEADGHHLLTDVWTSLAVIAGVGLVSVTGLLWLDPLSAALVAGWVVRTGGRILRRAMGGLVDSRLGPREVTSLEQALAPFESRGIEFKSVRTRNAGSHLFVHLTLCVPATWSVRKAHDLADEVERALATTLGLASVYTHIEPLETNTRLE